jgi:cytochrome c553
MRLHFAVGAMAMLLVSPAHAAGDAAAGKQKAAMCQVCHGMDGIAKLPDAPNLAGQNIIYLERSLKAYKTGERKHEQMSVIAQGIDDADIPDLAAYYGGIKITVEAPK